MQADQTVLRLRPGGGGYRGSRLLGPRFEPSSDLPVLRPHGGAPSHISSKTGDSRFESHERVQYTRDQLLQLREVGTIPEVILKIKQEVDAEDQNWGRGESNSQLQPQSCYSEPDNRDWCGRAAQFPTTVEERSWKLVEIIEFGGRFDARSQETNQHNRQDQLNSQFGRVQISSNQGVAPKSIATLPISDADIEATYSQAGEIARSIASASTSVLPLSSVDEATNQEILQFFNLLDIPFEELATSRSSELLSCMTKIQTFAATVFTEDQQKQLNEMADQLQSKVDRVQHYHDEIKAKNDDIASIGGIPSSILSNNGKETELKQEDQQLATEEQELREKLERVIKQRLDIRQERETLYAETKDLLSRGKNGDAKIRAAKKELKQAQLKLKSLTDEWDFFKAQFF